MFGDKPEEGFRNQESRLPHWAGALPFVGMHKLFFSLICHRRTDELLDCYHNPVSPPSSGVPPASGPHFCLSTPCSTVRQAPPPHTQAPMRVLAVVVVLGLLSAGTVTGELQVGRGTGCREAPGSNDQAVVPMGGGGGWGCHADCITAK